jgi:hypothetical protein
MTAESVDQPLIVPPGPALMPEVALALGMQSAPGVYALLLGSGVSRPAQIPTGYEVMELLLRTAAAADLAGDEPALQIALDDLKAWWIAKGHGVPTYSGVLEQLAHTAAARRALLAPHFVRAEDDPPEAKSPTAAHRAVARLVRRGSVRVVLTTNFDRLLERALDDLDVPYQVISRPEALAGAEPLTHAKATVVKLHGDWQDLDQRNTTAELTAYDARWDEYLDRLLPDHGLIAVGWSADSDRALVQAIERTSPRRYPTYYVARGSLREAAHRLVATRGMHVVRAGSADAFFTNLLAKVWPRARPPAARAAPAAGVGHR